MSTQRLDLPCNTNFPRKESTRSQPVIRPVGPISLDNNNNTIEARTTNCSLKHTVVEKERYLDNRNKGLKRLYQDEQDESFRAKRKRGCSKVEEFGENEDNFWFSKQGFVLDHSATSLPFSPQLRTSPWSFVNELADLGERGVSSGSHRQRVVNENVIGVGVGIEEQFAGKSSEFGCRRYERVGAPNPNQSLDLLAIGNTNHDEEVGFELISLLLACLEAIGVKNIAAINHFISKLGELASPRGDSSISRLAAYYTEALALRVREFGPIFSRFLFLERLIRSKKRMDSFTSLESSNPNPNSSISRQTRFC
ncbi:unnamed protein product [Lactuca saligna]|uniref:Uncharacterized protein n=1 Tax=Lactuca saligna TaxID=75948 RepID=A0AA35ZBU0_LACSI|nr:unnamed protein product [Lactuca saligna]